jgi:hypothetical protein
VPEEHLTVAGGHHIARMSPGEPDVKSRLFVRHFCEPLIAHVPQWDAGSAMGAIDSALHVDYIHLTTYVIGDVGY